MRGYAEWTLPFKGLLGIAVFIAATMSVHHLKQSAHRLVVFCQRGTLKVIVLLCFDAELFLDIACG